MTISTYTPHELRREARACVKGLGQFIRHEIAIHDTGAVQLRVYFVRHFNPYRPLTSQAVEVTTLAL